MDVIEQFRIGYIEYNDMSADRALRQVKALREFEQFTGKPLIECGATELREYLAKRCVGHAPTTVAWRLKLIRPFYGWAFDEGLISAEALMAVRRVKAPRQPKQLPKPYSRKELRQFWEDLDRAWPTVEEKWWKRWRQGRSRWTRVQTHAMRIQIDAIVHLALHCGLRRIELYNLTVDDIDPDNLYVIVRKGKGGKPREVPYTDQARTVVGRWLALRRELGPDHESVWLSLWHGSETKAMRWSRFDKIIRTVGDYSLHRFRHTCATEWLRAEVSLEQVSRLLGHANLTQTLVYAEIVKDDIHKAVAKAEPAFTKAMTNGR